MTTPCIGDEAAFPRHEPVLLAETLEALHVREDGRYVDATLGDGGHAEALMRRLNAQGGLLGIDRDADALAQTERRLRALNGPMVCVQGNFSAVRELAEGAGFFPVDGVLFDLGVRSDQLDRAERGFSFMRSGPLDMRMDQRQSFTAADLVNEWTESELAEVLWTLGEERQSRRIAAAIVRRRAERRFETTTELADWVEKTVGGRRGGRTHPATRTFMAIRMAVNGELEAVSQGVRAALDLVREGGRVAVLTYHSIEDRVVKRIMQAHEGRMVSLQAGGAAWEGQHPRVRRVTRKPVVAREEELKKNPRARSAKLRVVERIET